MTKSLKIAHGHFSDKGRKDINQDFHGVFVPDDHLLNSKGIAVALADGISTSSVSQIASRTAVNSFLADYFCTSEALTVKKSAEQVLIATNSWLCAQTRQSQYRYEKDKGYVCTFSALVLKSTTAHIFHAGDSRILHLRGNTFEQLTEDHRFWVAENKSYLSRAFGVHNQLELDYRTQPVESGDVFVLMTDGVYEHVNNEYILNIITEFSDDLNQAAQQITQQAYQNGSADNLTIQIIRVDQIPVPEANEIYQQIIQLPFPPMLEARMEFDGFRIIRQIHASSRSHVFLAADIETDTQIIIKIPSVDLRHDIAYLERFMTEEWIARRINNAHVLKPCAQDRKRNFLYIVTEFIDGQTLTQWMIDRPKPDIELVRDIVEQIAKGLQAFHRLEMLHQDLRPENIMIDTTGTVKIIDFGATRVAGLMEIASPIERQDLLGTAQYTAPEYFLGEAGVNQSDQFSLAVITYQLLSGKLPYGAQVAKTRTKSAQNKLNYQSVLDEDREIPAWIDDVLKKALNPNPYRRYEELSEFVYDLRHPGKAFISKARPPLLERDPVMFWKSVALLLAIVVIYLLAR